MRKGLLLGAILTAAGIAVAENAKIDGSLQLEYRNLSGKGEVDSAKFNEYRDLRDGFTGDLKLKFRWKDSIDVRLNAENISLADQKIQLLFNKIGQFKLEVIYDKVPHRFSKNVRFGFTEVSPGNFRWNNGQISRIDMALFRDWLKVYFDIVAFDPLLNFRIEFINEKRKGTRPFGVLSYFGVDPVQSSGIRHSVIELPEPIDYDITDIKFTTVFSWKTFQLYASYYTSEFKNNVQELIWDNPEPRGGSKGQLDIYPNTTHNNISLTGNLWKLPLNTRITAVYSKGEFVQNDKLLPYTINQNAYSSTTYEDKPPDPPDPGKLKVESTVYDFTLTSTPLKRLDVKFRHRFYDWNNKTKIVVFPGYVKIDVRWHEIPAINLPLSFTTNTSWFDIGYRISDSVKLSFGYTLDRKDRRIYEVVDPSYYYKPTVRAVTQAVDKIYTVNLDVKPIPWKWLDIRSSYIRSVQRGRYRVDDPIIYKYWKYDEADRDRDRIQIIVSMFPMKYLGMATGKEGSYEKPLIITTHIVAGKDSFVNSPIGLIEDAHFIFGIDVDYVPNKRVSLNGSYMFEQFRNKQKGWEEQDPTKVWLVEGIDTDHVFGAGVKFVVIPQKLDMDLRYTYAMTDGTIKPAGYAVIGMVDDSERHTLNLNLKYKVMKAFHVDLGVFWETLKFKDYNKEGFENYAYGQDGNYFTGGALIQDYNVTMIYSKLTYQF